MNKKEIKERLYNLGADLCGIASVDRFSEAPSGYSLLITPEYKSMVWLSVILTELELEPDVLQEKVCNDCNLCVEVCPVKALEDIEMNQKACWDYAFGEVKQDWRISCHKCRDICPFLFGSKNKTFRRDNSHYE